MMKRKTQRRSQKNKKGGNEVDLSTICDELNYLNRRISKRLDRAHINIVADYLDKIDETLKNDQYIAESQVICMVDFVYNYGHGQKGNKNIKNVEALLDLLIANVKASSGISDDYYFQTHKHEFEKLHFALEEYLFLKKTETYLVILKNEKFTYYSKINDKIKNKLAVTPIKKYSLKKTLKNFTNLSDNPFKKTFKKLVSKPVNKKMGNSQSPVDLSLQNIYSNHDYDTVHKFHRSNPHTGRKNMKKTS